MTPQAPGDLENLPWGQLVFDYFTTLPLASDGPTAVIPRRWATMRCRRVSIWTACEYTAV